VPFSKQHADAACNFFELVLKHTQDEWFGKPFLLMPWQEEAVAQTFGLLDSAGNRIIQMVYEEVPKKAGKTEWAAGLALLVLILSVEPGCPGLRRRRCDPAGDERIPRCLQDG